MKLADAQRAIDEAFADRLKLEFNNLANAYEGPAGGRKTAEATFARGVGIHLDALASATAIITAKFKD